METKKLELVARSIRSLSMDAIQKANSGHPGLPLGCAEMGAVLFGHKMNLHPADPGWINRDRFVLSAGHGSMLLYSLLHLSGFDFSLEDIKQFRQLGSKTPGHPEVEEHNGIETTTGPLGAGFSNAVGMAVAETQLAARFNTAEHQPIDHHTFVLAGDGCMMEGITYEAASLAGQWGLGKLIVLYDSNNITIEGSTDIAFNENVAGRFEALGWQVLEGDGHNLNDIADLVDQAKSETAKPSILIMKTTIAKGSPNKAGTAGSHGAPLGEDEIRATKKALGLDPDKFFAVDQDALDHFEERRKVWSETYDQWQKLYQEWRSANSGKAEDWDLFFGSSAELVSTLELPAYKVGDSVATRKAGGAVLNAFADVLPGMIGGSADLGPSNNSVMNGKGDYSKSTPEGRNIHFGVREHAMGGIINGLNLHSSFKGYTATFLVFSDYMRPTIRLAALMQVPSIFVFSHDSVYVGEDGPTHQPIEHTAVLRAIPNLLVLRPGDAEETNEAWRLALAQKRKPAAMLTTRQNVTVYQKPEGWKELFKRGAYIVKDCQGTPDVVIVATGSEVNVALDGAALTDKAVRVVSMPSRELFFEQDKAYRTAVIPAGTRVITVEAGVTNGWECLASSSEDCIGIDQFGVSGPGARVADYLKLNAESVAAKINA